MAISFPSSPAVNDTYTYNDRTWKWNGTTWIAVGTAAVVGPTGPQGKYTISDTAPSSPTAGDTWYNSTDSSWYIYYDSFWVEANAAYTGATGPTGPTGPAQSVGKVIAMSIVFGG